MRRCCSRLEFNCLLKSRILIDRAFRPYRDRNGADVLSLSNKVSNHAMIFANLKVSRPESH